MEQIKTVLSQTHWTNMHLLYAPAHLYKIRSTHIHFTVLESPVHASVYFEQRGKKQLQAAKP